MVRRAGRKRHIEIRTPWIGAVRTLLVVAVLGCLGYALSGQPLHGDRIALYWLILAGTGLMVLAGWKRLPRGARSAVQVVAVNLAIAVVAVELTLALIVAVHPSPLFANLSRDIETIVRRKSQEPGWTFMGFPFNSSGFYDEEFSDRDPAIRRVASISDSFVWGAAPHAYHFTTVCERLTGAEVLNLGYSATGLDVYEYLVRYQVPALDPDAIIVHLFMGNDLVELIERPPAGAASRFLDREQLLLVQIPRRLWSLRRETARRQALSSEAAVPPSNPFSIWRGPLVPPEALERTYPWLTDATLEPPTLSVEAFMEIELQRARWVCVPGGLGQRNEPRLFDRLRRLREVAGDIPIGFVLIPDEFQVEDALWSELAPRLPGTARRLYPQERLARWFDANDVPYVDLHPRMIERTPLPDGSRHLYHARDTHFNRFGNEVAGQAMAEFIDALLASR